MDDYQPGGVSSLLHGAGSCEEDHDSDVTKKKTINKKLARLLQAKEMAAVVSDSPSYVAGDTSESPGMDENLVAPSQKKKPIDGPGKGSARKRRPDNVQCTIFVGNVSTSMDKKAVTRFFRKYGKVESVRFRSVMRKDITLPKKVAAITKGFHDKCQSINAYVVFSDVDSARAALASNGELLGGLHLRVDSAAKDLKHDNKRSVFIGNMPFDASEEEVRTHFEDVGEIEYVRLIRDPKTRIGKGFGYIQFESSDSVDLALRLHEQPLRGRKLRLQRCVKKEKAKPALSSTQAAKRRLSAKQGSVPQSDRQKAPGDKRRWQPGQPEKIKKATKGQRPAKRGPWMRGARVGDMKKKNKHGGGVRRASSGRHGLAS